MGVLDLARYTSHVRVFSLFVKGICKKLVRGSNFIAVLRIRNNQERRLGPSSGCLSHKCFQEF